MTTDSDTTAKSQQDMAEMYLPIVGGGVLVLGVIFYFYFVTILWIIFGISFLAAVLFGLVGATSPPGEERNSCFVVAGVVGVIALGAFVWVRQYNSGQSADVMASQNSREDPKKLATLEFWNGILQIEQSLDVQLKSRAELSQLLKTAASRIESLPTLNVEPVLVIWSLEAAASLRELGQAIDELIIEDENALFRSFWNGFSGNIVGVVEDLTQGETPGARQARLAGNRVVRIWDQQGAMVRAKLTEKYKTNFLPLSQ